jgi:pimeloyl-ACP methyl ester carboxylesterase
MDTALARPQESGFALTDDGVRIHWRSIGAGPPVVFCNGVGVSTFFWKYVVEQLSDRFEVILWDYRGHGRSARSLQPDAHDLSIDRHAADLEEVLDDAGIRRPALVIGHSMGCQVALQLALRAPKRVAALGLWLGTAGRTLHTFGGWSGSVHLFRGIHAFVRMAGEEVNRMQRILLSSPLAWHFAKRFHIVDPYYTKRADMEPYMRHMASMDMGLFLNCVREADAHDAWPSLGDITVPTLVVAAERDTFTPLYCSKEMAEKLPQGELFVLADASHAALIEQPETIGHRLERFLTEQLAPWPDERTPEPDW